MATAADAAAVTEVFAVGFFDDPTWAWAFPDAQRRLDQHRRLWGLFVNSAVPPGWVWVTEGCASAAIWVPPGEPDLSEADRIAYEPLLREGVIVRPMGGYGFHTSLRINTGTDKDHEKLLAAVAKVLKA